MEKEMREKWWRQRKGEKQKEMREETMKKGKRPIVGDIDQLSMGGGGYEGIP